MRYLNRLLPFLGWVILSCARVSAQDQGWNLTQVLEIATGRSEQVRIAESVVRRAGAEQIRARAQRLPQVNGQLSYTRTLATEFSALAPNEGEQPQCAPLTIRPDAPVDMRLAEVERFLACGGPSLFSFGSTNRLPFGRTNIWLAGLSFTLPIYSGGRIGAQGELADAQKDEAEISLTSTNAQFVLDVTQAFYDTALARQLLSISESTLEEATRTLEFTRLGFEVGRLPEFDLLRAQVARGNQLPEIARRRAALAQSQLRLKQLLDIPPVSPIQVDADLLSADLGVPEPFRARLHAVLAQPPTPVRAPIRQADAVVRQNEANLRIARSQRLPSINVVSDYHLVAYPPGFFPTAQDHFRNNWTLGAALQIPIFQGGRIRADIVAAEANLDGAIAQRQLTRELAQLDTAVAQNQLATAEEAWRASAGIEVEAGRALEIARLRYRQGISSQLELNDARLAFEEARVNRAQAARDLQVARATVALLPLLPLNLQIAAPGQPQLVQRTTTNSTGRSTFNPFASSGGAGGLGGATLQQQQNPLGGATVQQGLPRTGSRRFP